VWGWSGWIALGWRTGPIDQVYNLIIELDNGNSQVSIAASAAMMQCNNLVVGGGYDGRARRSTFSIAGITNVAIGPSTATCAARCRQDGASSIRALFCVKDSNFLVTSSSVLRNVDYFTGGRKSVLNVKVASLFGEFFR
jgi:hypothetical protein